MQRMQEISSAVVPRVQTGRLPPDGTRLVQGMDAQGNEEMKNLIKSETAEKITSYAVKCCDKGSKIGLEAAFGLFVVWLILMALLRANMKG